MEFVVLIVDARRLFLSGDFRIYRVCAASCYRHIDSCTCPTNMEYVKNGEPEKLRFNDNARTHRQQHACSRGWRTHRHSSGIMQLNSTYFQVERTLQIAQHTRSTPNAHNNAGELRSCPYSAKINFPTNQNNFLTNATALGHTSMDTYISLDKMI